MKILSFIFTATVSLGINEGVLHFICANYFLTMSKVSLQNSNLTDWKNSVADGRGFYEIVMRVSYRVMGSILIIINDNSSPGNVSLEKRGFEIEITIGYLFSH